jgi:hypothetical protein
MGSFLGIVLVSQRGYLSFALITHGMKYNVGVDLVIVMSVANALLLTSPLRFAKRRRWLGDVVVGLAVS